MVEGRWQPMTAPTTEQRLAAWQTEPCPPWCTVLHDDADDLNARACTSQSATTPLTHEPLLDLGGGTVALDTQQVTLEAPHTATPRIVTSRGNGATTVMSLDEAEQHARQILDQVRAGRASDGRVTS
jgi:hypothetical protein